MALTGVLTVRAWEDTAGLTGTPAHNLISDPELTADDFEAQLLQAAVRRVTFTPGKADVFAGAAYHRLPCDFRVPAALRARCARKITP